MDDVSRNVGGSANPAGRGLGMGPGESRRKTLRSLIASSGLSLTVSKSTGICALPHTPQSLPGLGTL